MEEMRQTENRDEARPRTRTRQVERREEMAGKELSALLTMPPSRSFKNANISKYCKGSENPE